MKYYGFKTTRYGNAYPPGDLNRKRAFYDALVRAGRKHARQEGKKEAKNETE